MPQAMEKSKSELQERFLRQLKAIPGGERINMCIQCGTCSGSCPAVESMDFSPRQIFGLIRGGYIEKVLKCNTQWQCISCYLCTVRCPAEIKITEILYALRYLAIMEKMVPKDFKPHIMMKKFTNLIRRFGKNWELGFLLTYYLSTSPIALLAMSGLGSKMFFRGRLSIMPTSIKGIEGLRKILDKVEELEVSK